MHFTGSNCLPFIWALVAWRMQGESVGVTLVLWPFGDQYCTDIQSILLLTGLLTPFLLRWSVWCNTQLRFTLHCSPDERPVRGQSCCVISLPSTPAAVPRSSTLSGRSVSYLGPPLYQHRSKQSPVSCIGRSPRTSHMPTRVQHAHTQPCRHATDSNLACMITATLSCLGVLSHLALVFVAYPAACPAALIHRI